MQIDHRAQGRAEAEEIRVGWRMAGLAFEVASQVVAGALLGWLYDRWQATAPTGLLVGAVAGIAVGMFSLIRGALRLNRQLDLKHPTTGRGRPLPLDEDDDESEEDEKWDRRDDA